MNPTLWAYNPSSERPTDAHLYEPALLATTEWDHYLHPSPFRINPSSGNLERLTTDAVALILAAPHVGLTSLSPHNTDDWLIRLHLLYSINVGFRHLDTPEGPTPYPIDRHTLVRHHGLCFPHIEPLRTLAFIVALTPLLLSHCDTSPWSPTHAPRRQPLQ